MDGGRQNLSGGVSMCNHGIRFPGSRSLAACKLKCIQDAVFFKVSDNIATRLDHGAKNIDPALALRNIESIPWVQDVVLTLIPVVKQFIQINVNGLALMS